MLSPVSYIQDLLISCQFLPGDGDVVIKKITKLISFNTTVYYYGALFNPAVFFRIGKPGLWGIWLPVSVRKQI